MATVERLRRRALHNQGIRLLGRRRDNKGELLRSRRRRGERDGRVRRRLVRDSPVRGHLHHIWLKLHRTRHPYPTTLPLHRAFRGLSSRKLPPPPLPAPHHALQTPVRAPPVLLPPSAHAPRLRRPATLPRQPLAATARLRDSRQRMLAPPTAAHPALPMRPCTAHQADIPRPHACIHDLALRR